MISTSFQSNLIDTSSLNVYLAKSPCKSAGTSNLTPCSCVLGKSGWDKQDDIPQCEPTFKYISAHNSLFWSHSYTQPLHRKKPPISLSALPFSYCPGRGRALLTHSPLCKAPSFIMGHEMLLFTMRSQKKNLFLLDL